MSLHPHSTPLPLHLHQRIDLVYREITHHTSIETLNRYRDEDRLSDWDRICDQLVDHYWSLDAQRQRLTR